MVTDDFMGKNSWRIFISLCMKAFAILRKHQEEVYRFITVISAHLYRTSKDIQKVNLANYIHKILFMDLDTGNACLKIKKMLNDAPKNSKTRLKNAVHGFKTDTMDPLLKKKS